MRGYRAASFVLGLALALLGWAVLSYVAPAATGDPDGRPDAYFPVLTWVIAFGLAVPGLGLMFAAASWRPGLAMLCHCVAFGILAAYSLSAWVIALFVSAGWAGAATAMALAAAHLVIILTGPPMDRRLK